MADYELMQHGGEKIVVEKRLYKKNWVISIRRWFWDEGQGVWRPGIKGINLSLKNWQVIMPHLLGLLEAPDMGGTA